MHILLRGGRVDGRCRCLEFLRARALILWTLAPFEVSSVVVGGRSRGCRPSPARGSSAAAIVDDDHEGVGDGAAKDARHPVGQGERCSVDPSGHRRSPCGWGGHLKEGVVSTDQIIREQEVLTVSVVEVDGVVVDKRWYHGVWGIIAVWFYSLWQTSPMSKEQRGEERKG
ncbi:hypothetical protein C8Q77DRAFT_1120692 [Trametes polyzona]|nr:hypothetical protein C8Q77DRAFT_1120692 [Trametes polyzona]